MASSAERMKRMRDKQRTMSEVTEGERVLAAERVALADVKPCSSRVEAARARLQIEAVFRQTLEKAKAAAASGVLPEAGYVWFRGTLAMMWSELQARLKAGDPE